MKRIVCVGLGLSFLAVLGATATRQQVTVAAQPVPQITSVDNVGQNVIINGQTDGKKQITLSIGKLQWRSEHRQGAFTASFEPSNGIPLGNGTTGQGFFFTVGNTNESHSKFNVHMTPDESVLHGQIVLRGNSLVSSQDSVFTIADIKQKDGKLVPIKIQLSDKP